MVGECREQEQGCGGQGMAGYVCGGGKMHTARSLEAQGWRQPRLQMGLDLGPSATPYVRSCKCLSCPEQINGEMWYTATCSIGYRKNPRNTGLTRRQRTFCTVNFSSHLRSCRYMLAFRTNTEWAEASMCRKNRSHVHESRCENSTMWTTYG
jgi:hypothetical protein